VGGVNPGEYAVVQCLVAPRSCSWTIDVAGWVVTHHSPEERDVSGTTLEDGIAWCPVWLMAPALGVGPFLI
jgi:hypothetical protein